MHAAVAAAERLSTLGAQAAQTVDYNKNDEVGANRLQHSPWSVGFRASPGPRVSEWWSEDMVVRGHGGQRTWWSEGLYLSCMYTLVLKPHPVGLQWAVGWVGYEMATGGTQPFAGEPPYVQSDRRTLPPAVLAGHGGKVAAVLDGLTRVAPAERLSAEAAYMIMLEIFGTEDGD